MTFTDWDGKKYLMKVKSYNIFKTISAVDTKYHYLCTSIYPWGSLLKNLGTTSRLLSGSKHSCALTNGSVLKKISSCTILGGFHESLVL